MFKHDWSRKVVFGLILLIVFGIGGSGTLYLANEQYQARDKSDYSSDKKAARDEEIATCLGSLVTSPSACISQAYDAENDAKRADKDLAAQQYMARTGFWMWLVGWLQALGAITGIYFIAQTLDASRIAVEQGRDANEASWKAVEVARKSAEDMLLLGEVQYRAYLSCDSGFYRVTDDKVVFKVWFTNRGQSPTLNCEMKAQVSFLAFEGRHFRVDIPTGLGVMGASETRKWQMSVSRADIGEKVYALLIDGAAIGNIVFDVKWTNVFMKVQSDQFFAISEEGINAGIPNQINGKSRRRKLNIWATKINIEHI